jgi:hypothetical protein
MSGQLILNSGLSGGEWETGKVNYGNRAELILYQILWRLDIAQYLPYFH